MEASAVWYTTRKNARDMREKLKMGGVSNDPGGLRFDPFGGGGAGAGAPKKSSKQVKWEASRRKEREAEFYTRPLLSST